MTLTERINRDTKRIIQEYNTDKVTFLLAVQRLHDLGWAPLDAWSLVEGTCTNPPKFLQEGKSRKCLTLWATV